MPRTMHSAYARMGSPSTCQTDVDGLGIAARVTGAHVPPTRGGSNQRRRRCAHSGRQIGAQRAEARSPVGRAGRVEHAPDQRAAHDDAVRERGHLGRLGAVADPQPDADRQVRVDGADPGDQFRRRGGDAGPGAGDAHQRGRVDEAAAAGPRSSRAARRSTTARPGTSGRRWCRVGGGDPLAGLVRDQVRGDHAGRARPRPGRGRTRPRRTSRPGSSRSSARPGRRPTRPPR